MKILVAFGLLAIVGSLGQALFAMSSGPDNSAQVVRSLTVRVALSLAVFAALMLGWHFGLIEPHGIR